ncbi:hypothetical protein NLU14_09450 [Marinobacter sp. 71-i]|uniref:Uncharacterized protein n=1 Tax=Marinobacter iranensis TaxID=2962607 RepID=A0ABT5Y9U6_9GAMM|nr:hypothetical protein [Marinobacter iranensis]MDF0750456.1 hypothetical protein [Marinobacter iranensis]
MKAFEPAFRNAGFTEYGVDIREVMAAFCSKPFLIWNQPVGASRVYVMRVNIFKMNDKACVAGFDAE